MFNLISKVMTYEELRKPLRRMSKAELVETLARVVNLLTSTTTADCDYGQGWYDSRQSVMFVCGLNELYDIQPLEEDHYVQNFVND